MALSKIAMSSGLSSRCIASASHVSKRLLTSWGPLLLASGTVAHTVIADESQQSAKPKLRRFALPAMAFSTSIEHKATTHPRNGSISLRA